MERIEFEASKAKRYRKGGLIYAFRCSCPVTFYKSWADETGQKITDGWIIVPRLVGGAPHSNVYGCANKEFLKTYEGIKGSGFPHVYQESATVLAYQPGFIFEVATNTSEGEEVISRRDKFGWVLRNLGGEVYTNNDEEFNRAYSTTFAQNVGLIHEEVK